MLSVIKMLAMHRAYKNIKSIAIATFNAVKDYENIRINQELTEYLTYMNLGVDYNEEQFLKYNALCEYYTEALYDLGRLEHDYRLARNAYYAHRLPESAVGEIALRASERHIHLREKYPRSSKLQIYLGWLTVEGYKMSGRLEEAIAASFAQTAALNRCKGYHQMGLSYQVQHRIDCYIKLRDFSRGKEEIAAVFDEVKRRSISGIKLAECSLRLGLATGNYQYAYEAALSYDTRTLKQFLTERHMQVWKIFEAYLHLLRSTGRLLIPEDDYRLRRFRIARFFNAVPDYARNKKGMNIQILIVQILHFAVQGRFGKITDRTEALERYCSRYLRNNEELRNNCFFRIVMIASQCDFKYSAVKRSTAKIYEKMTGAQAIKDARLAQDELIPYEELYEILLESMLR